MVINMHRIETICSYLLLACLFLFGRPVSDSVRLSLEIWWNTLLPGMFIPMILIRFIQARQGFANLYSRIFNRCFAMTNNAFAYFMCAILLGFPSGSLFLDDAYAHHLLNQQGAKRLLLCCCFPTPGFVILTLGSLYHDASIGWRLYLIQLASGCLLLLFTRFIPVEANKSPTTVPPFFDALSQAIMQSAKAMLMIGIYLLLFLAILSILQLLLPTSLQLPLQLVSEFSSGILSAAKLPISLQAKLILTSALLSFGGFCVHLQILSSLRAIRVRYSLFFLFRILQAIIALSFSFFLF